MPATTKPGTVALSATSIWTPGPRAEVEATSFVSGYRFKQLAEKVGFALVLGGAAVYRCDNRLVFSVGFSRCADTSARKTLFPQPVLAIPQLRQINCPFRG